jgi:hypothetical protein
MTVYSPEELAAGFEFKILRSATGRFKDGAFQRQCLEEEARFGWTLVEKFDNDRIRLKRPAAAKTSDASAGDPYRIAVGMTQGQLGLTIAGIAIGAVAVILLIVVLLTKR